MEATRSRTFAWGIKSKLKGKRIHCILEPDPVCRSGQMGSGLFLPMRSQLTCPPGLCLDLHARPMDLFLLEQSLEVCYRTKSGEAADDETKWIQYYRPVI